jgi:hypothetical protein
MMSRTRAEIGSSGGNRMRERGLGAAGGNEADKAGGVFSPAAPFSPSLAEPSFRTEIFQRNCRRAEGQKGEQRRDFFWFRAAAGGVEGVARRRRGEPQISPSALLIFL